MAERDSGTGPAHSSGVTRGEDHSQREEMERGADNTGTAKDEPITRPLTAKDSTGVNPQGPIDPKSPTMPPP